MTELQIHLREYNLAREHFASLIGVGVKSLYKYEKNDESLRNKTKRKIENGLRVLEKHALIAPKWDGHVNLTKDFFMYDLVRIEHQKEVKKYDAKFKELFEKELLV